MTDAVNSSEEKCQSKQEIIEIIKDKAEQHDNLKCDVCEYMCKKKETMKKHMNTKHNHHDIAKECSSKDTSEKVQDHQEQTETNEKKDKDKKKKQTECWGG